MKRCDWCQSEVQQLLPVENRDLAFPAVYAWVCSSCAEAVQDEHYCGAFCGPLGFGSWDGPRLKAFTEVAALVAVS